MWRRLEPFTNYKLYCAGGEMEASSGDEQPSSEGTGVLTSPESELSAGEPARDLEAAVEKITGPPGNNYV